MSSSLRDAETKGRDVVVDIDPAGGRSGAKCYMYDWQDLLLYRSDRIIGVTKDDGIIQVSTSENIPQAHYLHNLSFDALLLDIPKI